jgi:hypothetical protein
MKKYLSGLVAAFLMTAGFVALSEAPASAACGGQYQPACVATKTTAKAGKATTKAKPKVAVTVASNGNVKAAGKVTITIKPGNKKVTGTVKNGKATVTLPKLKAGKYTLSIEYTPSADSTMTASKASTKLTVTKPKKKKR